MVIRYLISKFLSPPRLDFFLKFQKCLTWTLAGLVLYFLCSYFAITLLPKSFRFGTFGRLSIFCFYLVPWRIACQALSTHPSAACFACDDDYCPKFTIDAWTCHHSSSQSADGLCGFDLGNVSGISPPYSF